MPPEGGDPAVIRLFHRPGIHEKVETCRQTPGAVLLDVREAEEFASGHIPGAVNLPLSRISAVTFPKDTPLFIYCLRGARSRRAAAILKKKGYPQAQSIGGIASWRGPTER